MAALLRERCGVEVAITPSRSPGTFRVEVDGRTAVRKRLPFVRPTDDKVLRAVEAALG